MLLQQSDLGPPSIAWTCPFPSYSVWWRLVSDSYPVRGKSWDVTVHVNDVVFPPGCVGHVLWEHRLLERFSLRNIHSVYVPSSGRGTSLLGWSWVWLCDWLCLTVSRRVNSTAETVCRSERRPHGASRVLTHPLYRSRPREQPDMAKPGRMRGWRRASCIQPGSQITNRHLVHSPVRNGNGLSQAGCWVLGAGCTATVDLDGDVRCRFEFHQHSKPRKKADVSELEAI